MAKKSMINKQQKKQKYSTREYTRCSICGRPHAVLRKYGICRICFRELREVCRKLSNGCIHEWNTFAFFVVY